MNNCFQLKANTPSQLVLLVMAKPRKMGSWKRGFPDMLKGKHMIVRACPREASVFCHLSDQVQLKSSSSSCAVHGAGALRSWTLATKTTGNVRA